MTMRGEAERRKEFRCRMNNTASTVRQITLMPPRIPPMIGPRGVELLDDGLGDVSLVAGASECEDSVSVVGLTEDMAWGGVVDKVFEDPLDDVSLESDLVGEIVIEVSV
jgi:hypothetical protein